MYDWANSAYILTVITAVLPVYFADVIVGPAGVMIGATTYSATTLWAYTISAAGLIVLLMSPVLGAVADFTASKKKFLMTFCYLGCLFTILLFFCGTGDVKMTMALTLLSQVGFVGGNVFYDAFLPHLGTPDQLDRISAKGFAFGYIGGDVQFLLSLGLIMTHETWGLSSTVAVRIALASAGLWWAGFSIVTWLGLKESGTRMNLPEDLAGWPRGMAYIIIGFRRTWVTTRKVRQYRHLLVFLLGFMMYNEGIQTVIAMATIFGREELKLETPVLMITLVVIQIVAMAGSIAAGRIAGKSGTKRTLIVIIFIWLGLVVYAYMMNSAEEYMALGGVVGLVLGGSQALSRSYYGAMIPRDSSAEFFGFYSVFTKLSAICGPFVFGLINQMTGSSRLSILSVAAFFLIGIVFLFFTRDPRTAEVV
jgi:UMF1 family MFS transporter